MLIRLYVNDYKRAQYQPLPLNISEIFGLWPGQNCLLNQGHFHLLAKTELIVKGQKEIIFEVTILICLTSFFLLFSPFFKVVLVCRNRKAVGCD